MKKLLIISVALLALTLGIGVNHYLKYDFEVVTGESYNWSNSQGNWTVVNYFAEWCAPCLREMPELNKFHQQNGASIRLFAISFDAVSDEELVALAKKYGIEFPIINNMQNLPWKHAPKSLPTTYILGPDGEVKRQLKGEQSSEKLKLTIETLQGL